VSREPRLHGQDDDAFLEWLQTQLSDSDSATADPPERRGGQPGRRQRLEHRQPLSDGGDAFAFRRFDDWT